jgi:predicted ATPase
MYPGTNNLTISRETARSMLENYVAKILAPAGEIRITSCEFASIYSAQAGCMTIEFTTDPAPAQDDPLPKVVG